MKVISVLATAVAALSLAGTSAIAQSWPNVRKACAADRQKLCPGINDMRAARKCMRSHMTDVSPDCHAAMKAAQAVYAARKAKAESAGTPVAEPPPSAPH